LLPEPSTPQPYLFGDLLAIARLSWVQAMSDRLEALGHHGYRRSDAIAMRMLLRGPVAIGRLGERLGVTRQAARKFVDALIARGYVRVERDPSDARKLNALLTPAGERYAQAVVQVIEELNRELSTRVSAADLAAADRVLRASITGDGVSRAARRVRPPDAPGG
jgi:DNA-binding MarR family transcriptional regulator